MGICLCGVGGAEQLIRHMGEFRTIPDLVKKLKELGQ